MHGPLESEVRILSNGVPCTVYPPDGVPNGTPPRLILHLYGSSGSHKEHNYMRPAFASLRRLLRQRACWVAVPELGPAHWMNEAACGILDTTITELTNREGIDRSDVHLLGTSMGAGSGLVYIARRPGVIRSMCACFPMTDWVQWVREQPGYLPRIATAHGVAPGFEAAEPVLNALSPMMHIEAFVRTPMLVIHGQTDKIVPIHHSRDFVAALRQRGGQVSYHETPNIGHDNAAAEPFQEQIADFIAGSPP